jgi:hypothetical protein
MSFFRVHIRTYDCDRDLFFLFRPASTLLSFPFFFLYRSFDVVSSVSFDKRKEKHNKNTTTSSLRLTEKEKEGGKKPFFFPFILVRCLRTLFCVRFNPITRQQSCKFLVTLHHGRRSIYFDYDENKKPNVKQI